MNRPTLPPALPRALPLAAALLLAACSSGDKVAEDERAAAAGEVLEGTISDAMIPYDQLRSQPPLADIVPSGSAGTPGATASPGEAGAGDDAESGTDTPAAAPAPTPSPTG